MVDKKYSLELKSVQTSNLRILFEVLKEVLMGDINIIFTKDSIKVIEMDGSQQCMINLTLDSSAFEYYYCEDKITIGINCCNFFKIIKTSNSSDTISFCIERDNDTFLLVKLENSDKNKIFESEVRLLDVPLFSLSLPDAEFDSEISLPSNEFQKICRDMNSLGSDSTVDIKSIGQQIVFCYNGDFSKQRIALGSSTNTVFDKDYEGIIQGTFNLKFLLLFTKATNLCNIVKIYLKNDYPLILEYSVGSLGNLKFILSNI